MTGRETKEPWHLDKRVPIATLVVLVVQFALGVMWITTLSNTVTGNVLRLTAMEQRVELIRGQAASQAVQLGRIEEGLAGVRNDINRLINTVERSR